MEIVLSQGVDLEYVVQPRTCWKLERRGSESFLNASTAVDHLIKKARWPATKILDRLLGLTPSKLKMQFVIQRKFESPMLPSRQDGKKHGTIRAANGAEKMKPLQARLHEVGLFFANPARGIIRAHPCHPWLVFPQPFSVRGLSKPSYA